MAYLIDGNNFIGQITPEGLKDPRSKYSLIIKLLAFQKVNKSKIILVFDGSPDPKILERPFPKKSFLVLYPHYEQNADMVIKDIILKQTDLRRFFVVSSDREIRNSAKAARAKCLNCQEFHRQLKKTLKEYKKIMEMEKNVSFPSPLEVDHWIEIFQKKK